MRTHRYIAIANIENFSDKWFLLVIKSLIFLMSEDFIRSGFKILRSKYLQSLIFQLSQFETILSGDKEI